MSITLLPQRTESLDTGEPARDDVTRAVDDSHSGTRGGSASGPTDPCASFGGDKLRETLKAFGRSDLAAVFYNNISADRLFLLEALLRVAARVIEQSADNDQKALREGKPTRGVYHPWSNRYTPWPDLPVEESMALIRRASAWLNELHAHGYSVRVQRRRRS